MVAGDGGGEPAAVAEEPVAGISAGKVAGERLWLRGRALSRMNGFAVTVIEFCCVCLEYSSMMESRGCAST